MIFEKTEKRKCPELPSKKSKIGQSGSDFRVSASALPAVGLKKKKKKDWPI